MANRRTTINKLDLLDRKLLDLRESLSRYSTEDLSKNPALGVWSPIQLIQHMLLSEISSFRYIQKKIQYTSTFKPSGLGTKFRKFYLKTFFKLPIKIKAPKIVDIDRSGQDLPVCIEELFTIWMQLRSDLRQLLTELPSEVLAADVYKHPIAGRLMLSDMIDFFDYHFDRHRRQLMARLPTD